MPIFQGFWGIIIKETGFKVIKISFNNYFSKIPSISFGFRLSERQKGSDLVKRIANKSEP